MRAKRSLMISKKGFSLLLQNVRKKAGHNILGLPYIATLILEELLKNWDIYNEELTENKEKGDDKNE